VPLSVNVNGGPQYSEVPEHVIAPDVPYDLELWAYNFSDSAVTGQVSATEIPAGFSLVPAIWDVTIEPMGRVQLPAMATITAKTVIGDNDNWFELRGDFGLDFKPVLAFRLVDHWEKE